MKIAGKNIEKKKQSGFDVMKENRGKNNIGRLTTRQKCRLPEESWRYKKS